MADILILKAMVGPFTNSEEVEIYLTQLEIAETEKVKQLYLEIGYARDNSLSIPQSHDLFLLKKDHKSLPLFNHAKN